MQLCATSFLIVKLPGGFEAGKPAKKPGKPEKTGKKPVKNREISGNLSRVRPEQLLFLDFFDYLKKTFPADSGRTGRARANLRPFLEFE